MSPARRLAVDMLVPATALAVVVTKGESMSAWPPLIGWASVAYLMWRCAVTFAESHAGRPVHRR